MIGHLILNCISVSFIKDIRKCIMFCVVMIDMLGKPLTLRTNRRNGKDKREKGGSKMAERRKG